MNAQTIDKISLLELELDNLLKHRKMFLTALDNTIKNPVLIKHNSDANEWFYTQKTHIENQIKNLLFF